jgi:GT2 family glycosyltransferase
MDDTLQAPVTPKVAAILVVHNQAPELRRALEALERSQNREQLEILVVDCASHDDTSAVGEAFPGVTMQRLPHHFGTTKALNIATRTAKAEFLLLLSPDVEVAPDTVARLAEQLEAANDSAAVCPLLADPQGQPVPRVQPIPTRESLATVCAGGEPPQSELDLTQESIAVNYPGRDALLVRKQFVIGMNYFDERFGEYWADADLAIKIRYTGKKIRLYPGIRATWHAPAQPPPSDVVYTSDRILGAATLLSKYDGFFSGLTFRLGATLNALFRFDFGLFSALAGGSKLGSQAS